MPLPPSERHPGLGAARLYFVCEARPHGAAPGPLLGAALEGGAGMLELREESPGDDAWLIDAARPFRDAAAAHAVPFILNDRPDLVEAVRRRRGPRRPGRHAGRRGARAPRAGAA